MNILVLAKIYEYEFNDNSYGFRLGKGAHKALMEAEKYVQSRCNYVVDIDLSKFLDTISKDKLICILKEKI